jgi:transposase
MLPGMSTTYPTDLTDAEWACVQRSLPPLSRRGRPRIHSLRRILDAIFSVVRTGCAWRSLPSKEVSRSSRRGSRRLWADAAYKGKEVAEWCQQQGDGWDLEVVEREPGMRGFSIQPRRWVVERSFAWFVHNR